MEDFFSDDPAKRRQTLGRLSREIKGSQVFSKEFEERLDKLVFMRNQFIHHLWVNQLRKNTSPSPLPSREEYDIIMSALRALAVEASYFDAVFKGFRYELAIRITGTPPSPEEDPTPAARWTRYIELFHGVLREGSSGRFTHETG